ncbi:metallophosphoesterase [Flavobacterium jejuense]|uniref:Metallophosphoesterase n=1 Tax=Flavobacterium jejuense TaxID=1544455 RepID=A0ABX0IVF5_9FLAO|nr:metallophosphoesterase [Flavobacterium jejuense]NHN27453.1 metallophosphoesterase [Flavobacterium jejuense]
MLRWLIPLLLISLLEFYSFQAVKTVVKSKWVLGIYLLVSVGVIVYITYFFLTHDRGSGQNKQSLFAIGLFLITFVPKIFLTLILLGEDIYRLFSGCLNYFIGNNRGDYFFPQRRRFVSQIALGLAAVPFGSLLYGMTIGKYNFKVRKQTLFFPDLPPEFDGTTITQISDIHSGSFDNPEKIQYAIDLINEQNSDLVLFTGDIVNTHAKEMHPWIDTFKRIHNPKLGKFSVLGNHDYGEYFDWSSNEEKLANFNEIKDLHQQIDFDLLLNRNVEIKKGQDSIRLIGVENWGKHFKKAGDLELASKGVKKEDFKILMSHDPSHWDAEVQHDDNHYHLTLSGHTHGFQFGIEIPGWIKWSPVQYVYKQWAGLYENVGRYVYVNRGFGFHAYPGRVGIMPEITVIELKKGENVA